MATTTNEDLSNGLESPANDPWLARLGYGLLAISGLMAIGLTIGYLTRKSVMLEEAEPLQLLGIYAFELAMLLGIAITGYFAVKILIKSRARRSPLEVIPEADRALLTELIKKEQDKAVDLYIRISSLHGKIGAFQKVGFTGLPLATAVLTLIFAALACWKPHQFLELTQLSLGAFIGSFVQRGQDLVLTTGETVQPIENPETGQPKQKVQPN